MLVQVVTGAGFDRVVDQTMKNSLAYVIKSVSLAILNDDLLLSRAALLSAISHLVKTHFM